MRITIKKLITIILLLSSCCFAVDLDDKIGQMIILGFNGNNINSIGFKKILKDVENKKISGVILFSKNIKSKNDLIKMNEKLLSSSDIAPFIAIDNEGGFIQRHNFYESLTAKEVADKNELEIKKEYSKMADTLSEIKFNLNFAPCVDLAINENSIIAKKQRSYSDNPMIVSDIARIFIEEHNKRKIITSIKHFPGHGSAKGDTHKGFVNSTNDFKEIELIPYKELKDLDKMNMVMVSHIYNENIDKDFPASLSSKTINDLLINKIGFRGVIISDDYDMGAIKKNYSLREVIVNAINSGIDILLFSNNIGKNNKNISNEIHKIIKEEIQKGTIKEEDINKSYKKIMALKAQL